MQIYANDELMSVHSPTTFERVSCLLHALYGARGSSESSYHQEIYPLTLDQTKATIYNASNYHEPLFGGTQTQGAGLPDCLTSPKIQQADKLQPQQSSLLVYSVFGLPISGVGRLSLEGHQQAHHDREELESIGMSQET